MKRTAKILILLLAVFLLSMSCTVLAEPLSDMTVQIPVQQIFSSNKTGVVEQFHYVLKPQTEGAPLPNGSGQEQYDFHMKGNTTLDLKLKMKQIGEYSYSLYQLVENEQPDYRYDSTVYQVTVYVYYDAKGQLSADVVMHGEKEGKSSKAVFQNIYEENVKSPSTDENGNGGYVQTGDENHPMRYVALMVFSIFGVCLVTILANRKHDRQGGNRTYEE